MGKGQKARLAEASSKKLPPSGPAASANKSAPVFVPGKGLVSAPIPVRPTPMGGVGIGVGTKSGKSDLSNASVFYWSLTCYIRYVTYIYIN